MLLSRIPHAAGRRILPGSLRLGQRTLWCSSVLQSKSKRVSSSDAANTDDPVKFSASGASSHRSFETFLERRTSPWYQPYIVMASTVVMLVYFVFLREENDWDEEIGRSIFERVPALRAADLHNKIQEAKQRGVDASDLERELKQLQQREK